MTESQIGARKNKSVRNHIFVVNSIVSDVLSSVRKPPIDLTVMDFKQMFDSEEVQICLNALYEAGIEDDTFSLIYEANHVNHVAVKTAQGLTERRQIFDKIMQGDVLGPLVSSNMVDKHIGKVALETGNYYLYKDKVIIPPLTMQDDTLGISKCGYKTKQMNEFINARTNIMNLQFGCDKCSKMHIGKRINEDICQSVTVDEWKEVVIQNDEGEKELKDKYIGRSIMSDVKVKKYLGDIIASDGRNKVNIKDKTNKAQGNVNKIITTLTERPYGHHNFKAAKLMRESILLGGLLTNSEAWINILKEDLDNLEKPDTILMRKILSNTGNPSKVFMLLEMGVIPVTFVLMQKRMNFLHYILKESTTTLVRQVFNALKEDSRKGDFVALSNNDREELEIEMDNTDIEAMSKHKWKKIWERKSENSSL